MKPITPDKSKSVPRASQGSDACAEWAMAQRPLLVAQRVDKLAEQTHLDLICTDLVGVNASISTKQYLPGRSALQANSWSSQATLLFCLQPTTVM